MSKPEYIIIASPAHRVVSVGAVVDYAIVANVEGVKAVEPYDCFWYCLNDPQSITHWYDTQKVPGPTEPHWRVTWDMPGAHRIVCRVRSTGKDYSLAQQVGKINVSPRPITSRRYRAPSASPCA